MDFVESPNVDVERELLLAQFKALSCDVRLRILSWLADPAASFPVREASDDADGGVCVSDIQRKAGLSPSTTSAHLSVLQRAGLVRSRRVGQWTFYERDEQAIARLADGIRDVL